MSNSQVSKIIQSSPDSRLIENAFKFAEAAHFGQKRFSGEEYIQHPIRVAEILSQMRLDPKTIAAGFLHDVLDDTEKTLDDIKKEFGKEIAFLVEGVSKLGKLRYPRSGLEIKSLKERMEEPIDFRAENLRKMFFAMAKDLRVILIKLADRLHNMETLSSLPPEKQKRIALETLEIFAPLANRLGIGDIKGKLEDLAFPYLYPKEFEWLVKNVKERYEEREKYLKKVKPLLIKVLKKEGVEPLDVHSRPKHYWSLYQKLLKYEMNFDGIYDLVALRIVLNDVESCYKALGIIHKFWKPLPGRIKDYIAFPKPNGYQALHTTLFCLDGKITEIQVKTEKMHQEAERGIVAHWALKEGVNLKHEGKKFAWVAQLKDWQGEISKSGEFWEGLKIDFFKNRIFAFTPKGDVIDLPEGATPVDFAYAVHTDLGNRCSAAKINSKLSALSQPLKNGDVVEIITDKKKRPSRDWLEFVKTSMARGRIKSWLKKETGKDFLSQEAKAPARQEKKEELSKIFSSPAPRPKVIHPEIQLAGEKGIQARLAKCCLPGPQNQIRAYVTMNRGASVHKIECPNLIRTQKKWPQKIVEASWSTVEAKKRLGLFGRLKKLRGNRG